MSIQRSRFFNSHDYVPKRPKLNERWTGSMGWSKSMCHIQYHINPNKNLTQYSPNFIFLWHISDSFLTVLGKNSHYCSTPNANEDDTIWMVGTAEKKSSILKKSLYKSITGRYVRGYDGQKHSNMFDIMCDNVLLVVQCNGQLYRGASFFTRGNSMPTMFF